MKFADDCKDEGWIDRLSEQIVSARAENKDYIDSLESESLNRRRYLRSMSYPCMAFSGHGRSGKDHAAGILSESVEGLRVNGGGISKMVSPIMASCRGTSAEEVFATRHEGDNPRYWFHWCTAYSRVDPGGLIRLAYATTDVPTGLRIPSDITEARDAGVLDCVVWVERPGNPEDPTLACDAMDCEFAIINYGDDRFSSKVRQAFDIAKVISHS